MEYRPRLRIAMQVAPLAIGLAFALFYYWNGMPLPRGVKRELLAPLVGGALLLLIFGPVLIGNYFAGRKGPPLS